MAEPIIEIQDGKARVTKFLPTIKVYTREELIIKRDNYTAKLAHLNAVIAAIDA